LDVPCENMSYDKNLAHYISATVIIVRDGKFLIAKRADWEKAFPGKWTVPGGKLKVLDYVLREKDSKYQWYNVVEDLCKRECTEEVGLGIKNIDYVTSLVFVRDDGIPVLVLSMWSEPVDKSAPVILEKCLVEYKWVTLEEAKHYDLIEGIYEELEMVEAKLRTGKMKEWGKPNQISG
jgi:8-oxo-dGTP pyrophosphatase MutT (NUDIX family)